jgi:hypothetical protein
LKKAATCSFAVVAAADFTGQMHTHAEVHPVVTGKFQITATSTASATIASTIPFQIRGWPPSTY